MSRQLFKWNTSLQSDAGEVIEFPIQCYWSPDKEGIEQAIAATAKGMAYYVSGMTHKYAVLGVYRA